LQKVYSLFRIWSLLTKLYHAH